MKNRLMLAGALLLALAGHAAACEGGKCKHGKSGCPMHAKAHADAPAPGKAAKPGCKHCAHAGDAKAPEKADTTAKTSKAGTAKAEAYACAMGDYAGAMTKDGKCPKCGMKLEAKN